jgi:hypothetical protein
VSHEQAVECGSKFPHASKADAERANRRGGLHAYRCTFCRKWHVGSSIIPKRLRFATNWPASLYAVISLVSPCDSVILPKAANFHPLWSSCRLALHGILPSFLRRLYFEARADLSPGLKTRESSLIASFSRLGVSSADRSIDSDEKLSA